jgi:hypothetical protein
MMINVIVLTNGSHTIVEVKGHACYAEKGKDIVCAGVSALCNALRAYLLENDIRVEEKISDGYLKLAFNRSEEQNEAVRMFSAGINILELEYGDYVRIFQ